MENNKPNPKSDNPVDDDADFLNLDFGSDIELDSSVDIDTNQIDTPIIGNLTGNISQTNQVDLTRTADASSYIDNSKVDDILEQSFSNDSTDKLDDSTDKIDEINALLNQDKDSDVKDNLASSLIDADKDSKEDLLVAPVGVTTPRKSKGKSNKKDKKSGKLTKLIASLILLAIIGFIAFMMFGKSDSPTAETKGTSAVKTNQNKPADAVNKPAVAENKPNTEDTDKSATDEVNDKANDETNGKENNPVKADEQSDKKADSTAGKDSKADSKEKPQGKDNSAVKAIDVDVPNPDKIVNADIPNDDSLIKEEIDLLADQGKRLGEQEQLLDKRVKMMDELTAKKQEQIELLEKQIAQLEKAQKQGK